MPAEILLLQEEFTDSIESKKVNLNEVRERVKIYIYLVGPDGGNRKDYLLTEMISLEYVDSDTILNMKLKVEAWKKTCKKASKERKHQRNLDDYLVIVTPDQVAKYEQSEQAVKARNLFDLVGSTTDHVVYQNDYCTMRDHLFCIIHFAKGHMSAVTGNVMMEEFWQLKYVDNIHQISVKDHKIYYAYGPAILTLNQEEFD